MCYSKPGPRCVSHIRQTLTALSERAAEAEETKRKAATPQEKRDAEEKIESIKEEIRDALFQYDGTSEGIARLVTDGVNKGDRGYHQERINLANLYRSDQMSLAAAARKLLDKNPGKIARTLRNKSEEGRELIAAQEEWNATLSHYMKTARDEAEAFDVPQSPGAQERLARVTQAGKVNDAARKRLDKAVADYAVTKHAVLEYKARAAVLRGIPDAETERRHFTRAVMALNHTVADYRLGKVKEV